MKTELERLVGYLAGRQGESAERIRAALGDPSSAASRLLEVTRARTRAMLEPRPPDRANPERPDPTRRRVAPRPARPARAAWLAPGLAAAVLVIAAGAAWWDNAERLRRLETTLARRDRAWEASLGRRERAWRGQLGRLEAAQAARAKEGRAAPTPPAAPAATPSGAEVLLARVEARLGRLEQRMDEAGRAPEEPDGPVLARLQRDVDGLRRAAEAEAKATRLELQAIRGLLRDFLQALARGSGRLGGPSPSSMPGQGTESTPLPFPLPMPGPNGGRGRDPSTMGPLLPIGPGGRPDPGGRGSP